MLSRLDKIKEIIEANRVSGVSPLDLIKPSTEWVEESEADRRYSICQGCPEFLKLTKQCKKCGCLMHLKTKLEKASCPIGKW